MSDDSTPLKHCHVCGRDLPATTDYFYRHKNNKDGFSAPCVECQLGHPRKKKRTDGLRTCRMCKHDFPETEEFFSFTKRDGFTYVCRKCHSIRSHEWYEKNKERRNQKAKDWQDANRDKVRMYKRKAYAANPQKERERNQRYRRENAEQVSIRRRAFYVRDRERDSEANKRWRKNNPERARSYVANRRARKLSAPGRFTKQDIKQLFKSQKGRCWYCQKSIENGYHIDHRIPLSRGGSNDPSNLVLACPSCNLRKGDRLPHEWGDRLL